MTPRHAIRLIDSHFRATCQGASAMTSASSSPPKAMSGVAKPGRKSKRNSHHDSADAIPSSLTTVQSPLYPVLCREYRKEPIRSRPDFMRL